MCTSKERLIELRSITVTPRDANKVKRPSTFKRSNLTRTNKKSKEKELRKTLSYYLPPEIAVAYKQAISESGLSRRDFLILCIDKYFSIQRRKVFTMDIELPKKDLKYFYDEVSTQTYERVKDHCMDTKWNKLIPMYKVVCTAITEMLIEMQNEEHDT